MKQSNKKIKEITFGFSNMEESADGLHFYHCSKRQLEVWAERGTKLGVRARSSIGVMTDFLTDADRVVFTFKNGKFDLLINGLLTSSVKAKADKYETAEVNLSGGENRVTLVFPSHTEGVLKELETFGDTYIKPQKYDTKILFWGDSITQGYNSRFDSGSFAHLVCEHFNAERFINGIGGSYFMPDAFETSEFNPDTVIIAYGTNDFNHYKSIDTVKVRARGFLEKVKAAYRDKKIVGILPIWRDDENEPKPMGTFAECRAVIKAEYDRLGITVLDGYQLVPHNSAFYFDTLHPNDLGFAYYAKNLIKKLEQIL